jgi:hypothetical protein
MEGNLVSGTQGEKWDRRHAGCVCDEHQPEEILTGRGIPGEEERRSHRRTIPDDC